MKDLDAHGSRVGLQVLSSTDAVGGFVQALMHMEVLMDMEAGWVINRVRVGTGAGEERRWKVMSML